MPDSAPCPSQPRPLAGVTHGPRGRAPGEGVMTSPRPGQDLGRRAGWVVAIATRRRHLSCQGTVRLRPEAGAGRSPRSRGLRAVSSTGYGLQEPGRPTGAGCESSQSLPCVPLLAREFRSLSSRLSAPAFLLRLTSPKRFTVRSPQHSLRPSSQFPEGSNCSCCPAQATIVSHGDHCSSLLSGLHASAYLPCTSTQASPHRSQ
ncbi:uncharacterized protein LOC141571631 [Rhinolophus sinicus]|uniref:uncharacterized protein LOC141571631 n=1 Tax=Rhinolophus sinicus TaxID=89399 RepID=UPI003D7BF2CB